MRNGNTGKTWRMPMLILEAQLAPKKIAGGTTRKSNSRLRFFQKRQAKQAANPKIKTAAENLISTAIGK